MREVAWVEAKLFWRDPFTVVFVLLLPLATLYLLNGVFASETRDPTVWEGFGAVDFYTPSYVGLVTATVGVVSLPAHLTSYRERGVMRRFQASPLPMATLLGAQCVVATLTGTVSAVVTVAAARLAYDAQMPVSWPGVLAAYVVVAVAFAVLGVLLGLLLPSSRRAGRGHPALLHVHDAGRGGSAARGPADLTRGGERHGPADLRRAAAAGALAPRGLGHHRHRGDGWARGRGTRPDLVAGAVLGRDLTRSRRCT